MPFGSQRRLKCMCSKCFRCLTSVFTVRTSIHSMVSFCYRCSKIVSCNNFYWKYKSQIKAFNKIYEYIMVWMCVHVARFHFRNENRLTARWRELFVVLVHFFLFPGQCFIEPCIERFYPFHVPTDALFSGCTASLLRSVTDHYIWFSWAQPKVCLSSLRLLTVCLNKLFITFKQSIGFYLCNDIPLFHQNHFKFLPMSSVITATVIWASCFSQLFTKRQCFKMLSKLFTKTLGIDRVVLYTANEIRA